MPSNYPEFFILNEDKVNHILASPQDQEMKDFLLWLKSVSGSDSDINNKNRNDMTPASQDIKA